MICLAYESVKLLFRVYHTSNISNVHFLNAQFPKILKSTSFIKNYQVSIRPYQKRPVTETKVMPEINTKISNLILTALTGLNFAIFPIKLNMIATFFQKVHFLIQKNLKN